MKREWTDRQRKRVATLAKKGYSAGVIAKTLSVEFGEFIHGTAIARLLQPPKGPYTPEDRAKAVEMFHEARRRGDNLDVAKKEIAKAIDRTPQSIDAMLRVLGEIDIGDQRDHVIHAPEMPWPASVSFGGKRETGEGSVSFQTPVTPARPMEYRSNTGNSAALCAETRGATVV